MKLHSAKIPQGTKRKIKNEQNDFMADILPHYLCEEILKKEGG